MPTVYIANKAIDLPVKFVAGQVLSEAEALFFNREYLKRLGAQIRWRKDRKEIDERNIQPEATKLGLNFVFHESQIDDTDDDNDPVIAEAMKIAIELIRKEMATSGITEIPNLEIHAKAVVEGSQAIRDKARARVEARWKLVQESMDQ